MATRELRISDQLQLPVDAVTETFGILAVKRAGKSNAGVVMAEEMFYAGLPWIAIDPKGDWWGIRSSGDGKGPGLPIVVFGGLHADVPLEPGAGALVADIVVDQRLTCVIDVSEMTKADQRRFLTPFIRRLYQRNREPLHVFAEEADEYIPQVVRGDDAEMVGAWENLVKRGGFRGLGCTLITQRSASLNNDVLTQIQTLMAMRTMGVPDRKRIEEWVSYHQAGKEFVQQLPTLADGEALVFSPNFLRTVQKIRFRRRATFDSGATPKVGMKARPPAILADVDLAALRDKMAATIEKAKADDPRELRKRIAELERDLQKLQKVVAPKVEVREVERIVERLLPVPVDENQIRALISRAIAIRNEADMISDLAQSIRTKSDNKTAQLKGRTAQPAAGAGVNDRGERRTPDSLPALSTTAKARPVPPVAPVSDGKISPQQQRILDTLAMLEDVGLAPANRPQLAAFIVLRHTSGGFKNYLGGLRSQGLIDYPDPGHVALTDAGRALAHPPATPLSTEDLQERFKALVSPQQRRILDVLIEAHPQMVTRQDLADAINLSVTSGGFKNYLGQLRTLRFIDYVGPGQVAAADVLFLEGR